MQKILSLILVLILVIGTLFACKKRYLHIDEPTTKALQTSEESSSETTQLATTDDQSSTEETTSEEISEESTTDIITVDTIEEIDGTENTFDWDSLGLELIKPENITKEEVTPR